MTEYRADVEGEIAALEAHIGGAQYDDKELLEAEQMLRSAYRSPIAPSTSPSDIFAGTYRTENKKFKSGPLPEYLIDPDHPNERRDTWATRTHAGQQSSAHFSRTPGGIDQYDLRWVHGVVNSLPERYLVFIKGEFMPEGIERGRFLARSLNQFWGDYQPELKTNAVRAVIYVFAQSIIAMDGGRDPIVLTMIRRRIDIKRTNWSKNYLPHWRALRARYEDLRRHSVCAFLDET